ncbi:MAG: arginine--tRNA ligase [Alphaproteobacteria bacterium]|nr:arginine--tRNA ligase [Alphaproteobacteria bacterium]
MNLFAHFRHVIVEALNQLTLEKKLPSGLNFSLITCEPPRDPIHGDIATNAAMVLAKAAKISSLIIAKTLVERLKQHEDVKDCNIAGPGFVNITFQNTFWHDHLALILHQGSQYGVSNIGQGIRVNLEYVSANPTGPMHVGHSRGAVFGDVLASVLEKVGYEVCREFYINDAGTQTDNLARSVYQRYLEALGEELTQEVQYPGDYLISVGKDLAQRYGNIWIGKPEAVWLKPIREFAIEAMLALIRRDLAKMGIRHDVFTSERALVEGGAVDDAFHKLEELGLIYVGALEQPKGKILDDWEPRPQTLFRSSQFGDEVDRPLKKSDGSWAYIAADIAYHYDKYQRGFKRLIDVLGVDHGGYVKRINAATKAVTQGQASLEIKLCELVRFMQKGEPLKMSKRSGTFITVEDVISEVGADVLRFMMLTRKNDAPLDFDLAKVIEKSKDNPVFYVQYAHARACSVMRHAAEAFPEMNVLSQDLLKAHLKLITAEEDLAMIKLLSQWPRQVELAAEALEPHRLAFYLNDIAAGFHTLWAKGKEDAELRFIFLTNKEKTVAKLALIKGIATIIASGLEIFGIKALEEMR